MNLSRQRLALLGLLAVTLVTASTSGAAGAHANYLRSDPAPNARLPVPPARVVVGFSDKVNAASSGLAILDRTGTELAAGTIVSLPDELTLPVPASASARAAVYTVLWHTVSAEDGDAARGYFSFAVGAVPAAEGATNTQSVVQGSVSATLGVMPLRAGENAYSVALLRGNNALGNVSRVRLRVTPLDRDIGQSEIVLQPATKGFTAQGFELPFAGRYRIQVQVRRSDSVDDLAFDFEVQADAPSAPAPTATASATVATPAATATSAPAPEPMVSTGALMLGVLLTVLAAATAIIVARRRA